MTLETVFSADGTDIQVFDQGHGPAIVMVGPGLDDGTQDRKLAAILAPRFRVLRMRRRQYRLDLKTNGSPCSIAQEVDDVLTIAHKIGKPIVIYGHSSGGVVALEALATSPSSFAGAVLFEPAAVIGPPLGGEDGVIIARARGAIAAHRPGRAMAIFLRDTVGLSPWQARLAGMFAALVPHYRSLIPCQIDDLEALDRLGVRLETYAQISVPTLLLGADRSPAHLTARLDAIERAIPRTERTVMHKQDHSADRRAPRKVARVIEMLADEVLSSPG